MMATARTKVRAGKGCLMVFFGFFALIGLFAIGAMWGQMREALAVRSWAETPATITSMEAAHGKGSSGTTLHVTYDYEFAGKAYTGTRIAPSGNQFDQGAEAIRAENRYRPGSQTTCFVNPKAPAESYLEKDSVWQFAFILIPLIFVAFGVGAIYLIARYKGPKTRAISARAGKGGMGKAGLRLFGTVFMLVGGGIVYGLTVHPLLKAREAASWPAVPCTITSSRVQSHSGDEGGTTYSLDIRYEYEVAGETYASGRYDFSVGSSSGREWRDEVVREHPPGRRTVCYVNPADPSDAVLNRESGASLFGLLGVVFFLAGLAVFIAAGKAGAANAKLPIPRAAQPAAAVGGLRGKIGDHEEGPVSLAPASSPLAAFIVLLIISIFWNGFVWGLILFSGAPTGAKVFLGIFALIGAGLLAGTLYQFLALFNPRPTIQATSRTVRLGETLEVRYQFAGQAQRIKHLRITLKAEELATYRRGTDTQTDRHVFFEEALLDTADPALMRAGAVTLKIPGNSMHSFDAANNKIVWMLKLHGDIPKWPDVDLDFPLAVLPHAIR